MNESSKFIADQLKDLKKFLAQALTDPKNKDQYIKLTLAKMNLIKDKDGIYIMVL